MKRRRAGLVVVLSGALALLASARRQPRRTATSSSADLHRRETAKLKLSAENGRIEVEFEVDQNRNGVPWTVVLRRTEPPSRG